MKQIPLHRFRDGLFLNARINDSFSTEFQIDTGCSGTVISKEIGDMLYLCGKLTDDDITGHETSNWGNHYQTSVPTFQIKKLSFGRFSISDIKATICNRYGGPTLFGMSCFDKLKDYTITEKAITVNDGNDENKTMVLKQAKEVKNWVRFCHNKLQKLHKYREKHPELNYRFDYKDWCFLIYAIIGKCYRPLCDKDKYKKVIPILEDLRSLIQKNLEYDQEHVDERGSFITGYFNFYLASAYYQADRREEAIDYYEKSKPFFMEGTATRNEIDEQITKIKDKIRKESKEDAPAEPKPKLVPMRTMDFEGDIKLLGLQYVEVVDNIYGDGEKKKVFTGFKDFKTAYDFSITYHKRLEVIKRVDGVWYRTDKLPTDDFSIYDLELGDKYKNYRFKSDIENKATELIDAHDSSDSEFAERIEQNKVIAIESLKKLGDKYNWKNNLILNEEDLSLDGIICAGAALQWHDVDFAMCVIDVDDSIAKSLVDDVLAGKYIPCAIGQMPEDFVPLLESSEYFKIYKDEEFSGNNDSEKSKWIGGNFVVLDEECLVGFSYRETYDDIHWRWEGGDHSNQCGLKQSREDINKNDDYKFCYWQLVRERKSEYSDLITCKPY